MITYMMEWDVVEERVEEYRARAREDIALLRELEGLREMRALYNQLQGSPHVVMLMEFEDLATWDAWMRSDETRGIFAENRKNTRNFRDLLLGPSPIMPESVEGGG